MAAGPWLVRRNADAGAKVPMAASATLTGIKIARPPPRGTRRSGQPTDSGFTVMVKGSPFLCPSRYITPMPTTTFLPSWRITPLSS